MECILTNGIAYNKISFTGILKKSKTNKEEVKCQ